MQKVLIYTAHNIVSSYVLSNSKVRKIVHLSTLNALNATCPKPVKVAHNNYPRGILLTAITTLKLIVCQRFSAVRSNHHRRPSRGQDVFFARCPFY